MRKNINIFRVSTITLCFAAIVTGCATSTKRAARSETEKEIRLTEDREKLQQLRKNIPEETREQNDETALVLGLFSDPLKDPYQISSKFNEMTNRKRDEYSKRERRRRDDFSRDEKKKREAFLDSLKSKRDSGNLAKMSQMDRNKFFAEQDTDRRRFFGDESDARRDFESQLRQERQDFESHLRDVRSRFDGEYKNYYKSYNDRKKIEAEKEKIEAKKPSSSRRPPPGFTEQDMKDLESIPGSRRPIEPTGAESE